MMIANTVTFAGRTWEDYDTSKEWTLTSGDSLKTVYIKVKDRAGKISDIYSDNITLDTTAPTGLDVSINSDQAYTNSTTVTLTLTATGASKMRFNNSGENWSAWESYATEKSGWNLSSGSGTKTVYFSAKDTAGNIATAVLDTITLDTTAPAISNTQSSGATQTSITITWTTNEQSTSLVEYGTTTDYGSNTTLNSTKVTSHTQVITGLTAGTTYHYRVKSRDTAGNLATGIDRTFSTSSGADTTPPDAIEALTVIDKVNAESTLTLAWDQSDAPDFAGYRVYRKASSTFTNVTQSGVALLTTITARTTATYDDTTATDNTSYFYAVTAIDTASPPNENQTVTSVSGTSVDDKAPSTTDNISGGWHKTEYEVKITATDGGMGVDSLVYTTDGSDPTNVSNVNRTVYSIDSSSGSKTFYVGGDNTLGDEEYTIKYYSYDKNSTPNIESTHTATLKVDTAGPSTTDDAPSGWQNSSVSITLTATDATSGVAATYYTKNGSAPTASSSQYSSPILFTTQGNRTLKYFSKDNASNSESVSTTYILLDYTAPTSSIDPLSASSVQPFDVNWTSSDAHSGIQNVQLQYKVGTDGTWTTWHTSNDSEGTASFSLGSSGATIYFRSLATDNASNIETDVTLSGDTYTTMFNNPPTQQGESPTNGSSNICPNPALHVICNDTDGDAMNATWWSNSSGSWAQFAENTTISSDTNITQTNSNFSGYETTYWWSLNLTDEGGDWNNETYHFTTRTQCQPEEPTNFSASSASSSSITLTWTSGNYSDYTRIQRKTGSYPENISDGTNAYNGTGTSTTVTGLGASTTYYFRAWAYSSTDNTWSLTNASDSATTSSGGTGIAPGPSGDGLVTDGEGEEETTTVTTSSDTRNSINTDYGLDLEEEFYATDTDEDGVVDTFTDPNNVLSSVASTDIGDNQAFLISVDDDEIPEFFWDPTDDTVTGITHTPGVVSDTSVDEEQETVTVTVSIDKSDWVYIEVSDDYPDYDLTVKTSDGRTIESDKIWREDNKIYVLDDPDTEYEFIYNYELLAPTFNPTTGSTITTESPIFTITYIEAVTIESATWNGNIITLDTEDNMVFTYIPEELTSGDYTLSITVIDNSEYTRTDSATYSVDIEEEVEEDEQQPTAEVPWILWIIVIIVVFWIIIGILFKSGVLYIAVSYTHLRAHET